VPCADRPLVVGAGNDAQFAQLCGAIDLVPEPAWATNSGRVADRVRLGAALADVFRRRTAQEWADALGAVGVPCAPVQDLGSLPDDPQVQATGQLQRVAHPAGDVRVVGSPYRLDGERPRVRRAPPLLGQHTAEVLAALGLSPAHIEEVTGADRR
jgi:crotonobetainyl-CoA:carnitine CoA-transferase CaiB-like acyl-CoA transferase